MVSTSSQFIKRVEDAVFHAPYMIPTLFRDCKVKQGFIHSRLRRYVPHRVGIEFECFGDFANQYLIDTKKSWSNWRDFEKYFGILDFSQDSDISRMAIHAKAKDSLISRHEEIRVSIRDYRQLNGLYNILNEMAKYCSISDDCGIHIHIDLTKYSTQYQKEAAVKWFNNHLYEVESIFPKYKGTYNHRVAKQGKSSWVNVSGKDTIEFRIAPLTFDYEVLIPWIVKCSKLVSRMITECHLGKIKKEAIKYKTKITDTGDSVIDYNRAIEISESSLNWNELSRELSHCEIEYFISGRDLVLDYPDGSRAIIDLLDALRIYNARGLGEVIRVARTLEQYQVRDNRNTYSGTTLSDGWISYNDSLNEMAYYVTRLNNASIPY